MGYVPPYVPDQLLLTHRYVSSSFSAIKKVEAPSYKHIETKREPIFFLIKYVTRRSREKDFGKGLHFDVYA